MSDRPVLLCVAVHDEIAGAEAVFDLHADAVIEKQVERQIDAAAAT